MGPPELHIVLVGLGRIAQGVDKVQQTAVLLIPAGVDGPVEDGLRLADEGCVAGAFGLLQQEPDALDVVAGVDDPALRNVQPGFAVGAYVFQHAAQLILDVIAEDLLHAGGGPGFIERFPLRIGAQHDAGHVQADHGRAEGAAGPGLGDGLGAKAGGVRHPVVQIPVQIVGPAGPQQAVPVPGDPVVFGVCHRIEGFGEAVTALTQGTSVGSDGEIHPIPRFPVDAVGFHKIEAAPGGGQPFLLHAVEPAQPGKDPAAASLHPNAFIGRIDPALSVQAGVDAAVHRVHAMFQPEIDAAVQFLPDPRFGFDEPRSVHTDILLFCARLGRRFVLIS